MTTSSSLSAPLLLSSVVTPAPQKSLRSRAMRASAWTLVGYMGGQIIRLASNLVLTRMLFPAAYGKMALVGIFLQGLQMFSDVGVGPSIIRSERGDDPSFLNTAWTIQVMRGFALWGCAILLAAPMAKLYQAPDLKWLLPVVGFTAVIGGFNSTSVFSLSRHIRLAEQTVLELSTQFVTVVTMVGWAFVDRSVWALVAGNIASSIFRMIGSHYLMRSHRNRLHWDRECAKALFQFGRWIFISTVLTFFAGQADRLIFGVKIPLSFLGVYATAAMLAAMPTQAIIRIAGPVTFSVYSRLGEARGSIESVFGRFRLPLLIFGAWTVTGMIVTGPELVRLLYDPRYVAAGWILQMLAVSAWFEILETTNGSALLALNKPAWVAAGNGAKLIGIAAFIPLGFYFGGFRGALYGLIGSEMMRYTITAVAIRLQGFGVLALDLGVTALAAVAATLAVLVERAALAHHVHALIAVAIAAVLVSLIWAPMALRAYLLTRAPARTAEVMA
jgi:O-antigen/teichoic acid export membrane protein